MDRDPSENIVHPVERVSPSTGGDGTGTVGDESADERRQRQDHGTEPPPRRRSEPERGEPPSDQPPIPREDSNPGNPRPADR